MMKMRFVLPGLISCLIVSAAGTLFARPEIALPDREAIREVLEELGEAMVREEMDSIVKLLSPNMDRVEYNKLIEGLREKFGRYDYTEYKFGPPGYNKAEVSQDGRKVKFKAGYSEKHKSASGSGSSSGLSSRFVMEKTDGGWLILSTDFYSRRNAMLVLGIITGFFIIFGIVVFLFWLWMLIDCAGRDFPKANDKVVWILIIIFTQIIGAIIYYFMVKRKRGTPGQEV